MSVVLVLPPSESCSNLVILDSRYGICSCFLPCASAEMTFPSDDKLKLIYLSSLKWSPVIVSSLWIFSLPAKSHKFNLPLKSMPRSSAVSLSTNIWKIVWDRLEWILDLVYLVILFYSPLFRRMKQSLEFVTTYSLYPSTKMPVCLSSLMLSALLASRSWERSKSFSL